MNITTKMFAELAAKSNLQIANILRHYFFLSDKVSVWDFDGTMTAFRYAPYGERMLPCLDSDVRVYSETNNLYAGAYVPQSPTELEMYTPEGEHAARMLGYVQWIIKYLPHKERVFVLTRTEPTLIDKKNKAILDNFDILPENIYHVQNAEDKSTVLRSIIERFQSDIWFVEDSFKTQLNCEEETRDEKFRIHGIHISEFLV